MPESDRIWHGAPDGRRVKVRSKWNGKEGIAYPDDLHLWIEGEGIAGWHRPADLTRDFIVLEEEAK